MLDMDYGALLKRYCILAVKHSPHAEALLESIVLSDRYKVKNEQLLELPNA